MQALQNKAKEIDCLCCREVDAMLIALVWASAQILVTRIKLIYLVDEFFYWFLVQLNETRRLGESKFLSFCFWC